jgi:hypothetical protein
MADSNLPSWAWFSRRGAVHYTLWEIYKKARLETHTTLLDWSVEWEGVPYVSSVKSAHAQVKGPVLDILFTPMEVPDRDARDFQVFGEDFDFGMGDIET